MQSILNCFDIKGLIPYGYSLLWRSVLLWLNALSDLLIICTFLLTLFCFIRKRQDFAYPWLIGIFIGFIIACGTRHLLSTMTIYWPNETAKGFAAILSVVTALLMIWITPQILSLPRTEQLQAEIQQRKTAKTSLKESEFLWKFAIEGAGYGVSDRDIQNNTVNYSGLWKAMLDYDKNAIMPTHQEWLNRIHPEDLLYASKAQKAYLEGKTANYRVEYRLRCKNANYKWIMSRGMVVSHNENGRPLRMIGTHTDISERKKQELHDLAMLAEILSKTQQQVLKAGQIINRIKSFIKSQEQHRSTVDINASIHNTADLCASELKQNNIKLTFNLEENLPSINTDRMQIEQVTMNLIRNSIESLQNLPEKHQRALSICSTLNLDNTLQVRMKDNTSGLNEKKIFTLLFLHRQNRRIGASY